MGSGHVFAQNTLRVYTLQNSLVRPEKIFSFNQGLFFEVGTHFCAKRVTRAETSYHITCECPALWRLRREVFHTHHLKVLDWSISQILRIVKNTQIKDLIEGRMAEP